MEKFNNKGKNLKPIEAAAKILEGIGISQFAEAELSDNEKNRKEKEPENKIPSRKHCGGLATPEFKKMKKSAGPDEGDLPEGYTNPYDGE